MYKVFNLFTESNTSRDTFIKFKSFSDLNKFYNDNSEFIAAEGKIDIDFDNAKIWVDDKSLYNTLKKMM